MEREKMAQLIASIISGEEDAIPEQEDYDLADRCLALIKKEFGR